ncbi:TetR/AcrR family transcriptional regulator [Tamaricihabitans halophyticus]|nr:TetR/AcrR family transcriptional regulator [Tamaricihabitans halophyticus]
MAVSAELFATKGIGPTTVRDIGEAAGVFSGSLYHYFRSKNAIVDAVLARFMDDIGSRFQAAVTRAGSPVAVVRALINETLLVIDDHPHPTKMYQNDRQYLRDNGLLERVDSASRAMRGFWLTAIRAGIADGSFRADIPPEVFYRSLRDTLWATMHWPNRSRYSTPEFAELISTLFFDGFVVNHP